MQQLCTDVGVQQKDDGPRGRSHEVVQLPLGGGIILGTILGFLLSSGCDWDAGLLVRLRLLGYRAWRSVARPGATARCAALRLGLGLGLGRSGVRHSYGCIRVRSRLGLIAVWDAYHDDIDNWYTLCRA